MFVYVLSMYETMHVSQDLTVKDNCIKGVYRSIESVSEAIGDCVSDIVRDAMNDGYDVIEPISFSKHSVVVKCYFKNSKVHKIIALEAHSYPVL